MSTNTFVRISNSFLLAVTVSTSAFADKDKDDDDVIDNGVVSPCQYIIPLPNGGVSPVCVDVPVKLKEAKVVFNVDHMDAVKNRPVEGPTPTAMRHMWMLSNGVKQRIAAGKTDAEDVSIIGVFHGGPAAWLLNDDYWNAKTGGTEGNPYKFWLERLIALKDSGFNIQIEICGVTMTGKGWTNDMLYSDKIMVNQGAIGRIVDLENDDYALIQPGI